MARILLDHNIPFPLTRHLPGHHVVHASQVGWEAISNGLLIAAAENGGFEVLITADQNLEYQQNLTDRRLALIVLSTNTWPVLRGDLSSIIQAATLAVQGSYQFVTFDRPALRRRPFNPEAGC